MSPLGVVTTVAIVGFLVMTVVDIVRSDLSPMRAWGTPSPLRYAFLLLFMAAFVWSLLVE